MAQRPPKRYDPGELDRTRSRLGELSREEARRMARVLGGEVGVERIEAGVEEKYRRLQELNRRHSDHFVPPAPGIAAGRRPHAEPHRSQLDRSARPRIGFIDRVRMDFLAARPEHRIKSNSGAFASLLSAFGPVTDYINPHFIRNADTAFYTTIENLVIAVRRLSARYEKATQTIPKNRYFMSILTIIKEWEIEGMSSELARLQANSRRVRVEECAELCRMIYRPVLRLVELDPNYHIGQALKHYYDVSMLSLPKESSEVDKVKLQYSMAKEMQLRVFVDLKRRLYPLLMKLATARFSSYTELFDEQRELLLSFVGLSADKLVPVKELRTNAESSGQPESDAPPEPIAGAEEAGAPVEEELDVLAGQLPEDVQRGLDLLDDLFPQAGWRRVTEFPDMYPYFQPILGLPRGTELIPSDDPLQQITVVAAILQELFYGFRAIRFGTLLDEEGKSNRIGEAVEELTGKWHLFLDELVGKSYVSALTEFARQSERGGADLRHSEYSAKLESDLLWTKRRYFLPKLNVKILKGLRPNVASQVPKLWETVREVRELLEGVIFDIAGGRALAIENPADEFVFAVEGFISKRLRSILIRREQKEEFIGRRTSNVSLVFNTLLLLRSFDYLLNDERSFYYAHYNQQDHPLFRRDPNRNNLPLYNVPLENPFALIDAAERGAAERQRLGKSRDEEERDPVTRMETAKALSRKLAELIRLRNLEDKHFVVVSLTIRGYRELVSQAGDQPAESTLKRVAAIIQAEIRDYADLPYRASTGAFIVLLPETTGSEAIHFIGRLRRHFEPDISEGPQVSMGIVEHQAGWTIERLLRATQEAIREAGRLPSPSVVIFSPETEVFVPVDSPGP